MEAEVEAQLQEYAVALQGIEEAMKAEPHEELAEVRESLLAAVSELESALLEIKRSRLLASLSQVGGHGHPLQEECQPSAPLLEPLQPLQRPLDTPCDGTEQTANGGYTDSGKGGGRWAGAGDGAEPGSAAALVGTQCRFRYLDGRWYPGQVAEVQEGSDMASVRFEAPTRSYMLSGAKVRLSGLRPPRGRTSLGPAEPPSSVSLAQDSRGSNLQGSQKVFQVGDRVYVRPGMAQQRQRQQLQQQQQQQKQQQQRKQQQQQSVLWQAASVVSVSGASSEVVVMYEQDGTRSRVSRTDVVSEAWDGCSDLASDADDEDVDVEEGSDTSSSGSSSESGSDMDLYDAEGDDDGCQGRAALGIGADVGAAQHQYGRRSRKRPRQDGQEGDGEGGSVLGHVREAAEAGQLQDTKHFAQWEKHGRGVASRLMAKSGYTEGSGLGRRRTGIVDPVQALVLPKGQGLGLGSAGRSLGEDGEGSNTADGGPLKHKRRRGGERKRMAKHATAGREAREARHRHEDERSARGGAPGLFGFLNQALGDKSSTAAKIRDHQQAMFKHPADTTATTSSKSGGLLGQPPVGGGGKGGGKDSRAKEAGGADARARLMRQQGRVEHCQARVAHFQEMLQRNRANPSLASQIAQRLKDVQAELASEISEQARMSKNITGKDNQKKMMKF